MAAAEQERLNGPGQLLPANTQQITIMRIRASQTLSPNFGQEDIINCLLDNRIPVEWITHAYPYGVQYLRQHLASNDRFHDQYRSMEDTRRDLRHEPEAYPPFDGWYHPSPSDLVRLRYLMNREEQQGRFSRHSRWWTRIGKEPYPPLRVQQADPAPQPSTSSSSALLPSHDIVMQAPTVEDQHEDPTTAAIAAVEGVEGEPSTLPSAGEGSREIVQDVIMAVAALGVEEASSTLLNPSSTPAPSTE
jgi:hypothetical protein